MLEIHRNTAYCEQVAVIGNQMLATWNKLNPYKFGFLGTHFEGIIGT